MLKWYEFLLRISDEATRDFGYLLDTTYEVAEE
jgi:hypothetical protein